MANNIITAVFGALHTTKVAPRYRYDYGQILIFKGIANLPDFYEVHFANAGSENAIRVLGDENGVQVPDSLFTTGAAILAWVYVHDDATDGETVYQAEIPVLNRARPEDVNPEDPDVIAQAIDALNTRIEHIEEAYQYAQDAEASMQAAAQSEDNAATSASSAEASATLAHSWAIGGTSSRTGENTNNAKYFSQQSASSASDAAASATDAAESAEAAQSYAEAAAARAFALSVVSSTLVFTDPA